jgi:hypothetical protein
MTNPNVVMAAVRKTTLLFLFIGSTSYLMWDKLLLGPKQKDNFYVGISAGNRYYTTGTSFVRILDREVVPVKKRPCNSQAGSVVKFCKRIVYNRAAEQMDWVGE